MFAYLRRPPGFYRRVFLLALPVVLQNLITTSLAFMDTFMVGLLGSEEMAAVTVANTPLFVMQLLLFGIQSGSGVLISQYWGKKDRENINRVLGVGLYAAGGIGALFALLAFFAPRLLLDLITDNARLVELAAPYLRIVGVSYFFDAVASIYVGMQRSTENTTFGMAVFMASTALNTIGNYILIFGKLGAPALGVTGAAAATLLARVIELAICIVYLCFNHRIPLLPGCIFRPGVAIFRSFVKFSSPVLANETLWALGTSLYTVILRHMSTSVDMIAAYTVAGGIDRVVIAAEFGLAAAAGVIIGKEIGMGRDRETVSDIGRALAFIAFWLGFLVCGAEQLLFHAVLRPYLLPLFRLSDAAAGICAMMVFFYSANAPLNSFNATMVVGVLRGGGDVRVGLLIDLLPLWCVTIPLLALTALVWHAPVPVLCAVLVSESVCKLVPAVLRLRSGKWVHDVTVR